MALLNSSAIQRWAEEEDDGTNAFVQMLYFLLLEEEEPVVGLEKKSTVAGKATTRIMLTSLKKKIQEKKKKISFLSRRSSRTLKSTLRSDCLPERLSVLPWYCPYPDEYAYWCPELCVSHFSHLVQSIFGIYLDFYNGNSSYVFTNSYRTW